MDVVNSFPAGARRWWLVDEGGVLVERLDVEAAGLPWLVDEGGGDCSTSTRAAEFPGWLVGDEGIKPHIVHLEMGDAAGDCEQVG